MMHEYPTVVWFDADKWLWKELTSWGEAYEMYRRLRLEGFDPQIEVRNA